MIFKHIKIKYYHQMFWICYKIFGKWDKRTLHYKLKIERTYGELVEALHKKNFTDLFEVLKNSSDNISTEEILDNLKRNVSKLAKEQ